MCFSYLSESGDLRFASESVLGFGMTVASNVAQRLANAVADVVRQRMDAAEAVNMSMLRRTASQAQLAWLDARDRLSMTTGRAQTRLFGIGIYTDDSHGFAVGAPRLRRLLDVWACVCADFGLVRADAAKRQVGLSTVSLGVGFSFPLAAVYIPRAKVLRATCSLSLIARGEHITFAELRKLAGLLEHFSSALDLARTGMYGVYDGFGASVSPGARAPLSVDGVRACTRWL